MKKSEKNFFVSYAENKITSELPFIYLLGWKISYKQRPSLKDMTFIENGPVVFESILTSDEPTSILIYAYSLWWPMKINLKFFSVFKICVFSNYF